MVWPGRQADRRGAPDEPCDVNPLPLILGRRTVVGWPSGTGMDSEDTLNFSALTGVKPMTEVYPLEKASDAYERMMSGKARFRVVIKNQLMAPSLGFSAFAVQAERLFRDEVIPSRPRKLSSRLRYNLPMQHCPPSRPCDRHGSCCGGPGRLDSAPPHPKSNTSSTSGPSVTGP